MTAVHWDEPSKGIVSDPAAALELINDQGGALFAKSEGPALTVRSGSAVALDAATGGTPAARVVSDSNAAMLCMAPLSTAVLGANRSAFVAVGGLSAADAALPPMQSQGGIGVAGLSTRFAAVGVMGVTFGGRSTGVRGDARGGGVGVLGTGPGGGVEGRSPQGDGVAGFAQSARASGVYGFAPGAEGAGVSGRSTAGAGVDGGSTAGPGVRGVSQQAEGAVGLSAGANAAGVAGRNDVASGVGVDGYSQKGTAVRATSSSGTALKVDTFSGAAAEVDSMSTGKPALDIFSTFTAAVQARSAKVGVEAVGLVGTGVSGITLAALKAGEPQTGCGVYGNALLGAGVCGVTLAGTGVLGIGPPVAKAWAGRFLGNVHVDGTLYKSCCCFSIDHPLDPKRKVLNHASVESSEYKTFYDGTVTLDARGAAKVRLPRWSGALNHEWRHQLTAIGAPAPELHVAREFADGSFAIAGGRPRQKVCWQLTAVRRDAWARANPLQVEQPRAAARAVAPTPTLAELERAAAAARAQGKAIDERGKLLRKRKERAAQAVRVAMRATPADADAGKGTARAVEALKRLAEREAG